LEETTMKKLMTVGSALVLALTLGACKKEETPAAKPVEETKPVEAAKPAEPAPTPAPAADPAAAPAADSSGIPECDEYLATAAKFAACDKLPAEAKDAQLKGVEAAKSSWAALKDAPADAKKAAADSCKASNDGLKQAWTAAGCQ
jgi:hypothetical protein